MYMYVGGVLLHVFIVSSCVWMLDPEQLRGEILEDGDIFLSFYRVRNEGI